MAKCEEKIIHQALYEKAVEWCDELKYDEKLSDEYVIDMAHNIMFELQLCYLGENSSYLTDPETGKLYC